VAFCAIYCRVSTQDQAEKFSLTSQLKTLKGLARAKRLDIANIYNEGGVSGESISGRPEILRLLQDAEKGLFSAVLIVALDRLSRKLSDSLYLRETLKSYGVRIITPGQEYDPEKIEHDLTQNIFGSIADYERKRILERCHAGRVEKRAGGGWLGGHAPKGYKFNPGTKELEPDPDLVPVVKRVYELAVSFSPAEISRRLPEAGSARMVRRILERNKAFFYSGRVETYEGEIIPAQWPAIIPESLANRVLESKKGRRTVEIVGRATHLLTGLGVFKCAKCGATIKSFPGQKRLDGSRKQYYGCSSRSSGEACSNKKLLPCERIDLLVSRAVLRAIKNGPLPQREDKAEKIFEDRLRKTEAKIEKLVGLIVEGVISDEDGRAKMEALKNERTELTLKLETKEPGVGDDLVRRFLDLEVDLEDEPELRAIISIVVDKISLSTNRLSLILRSPYKKAHYLRIF